MTAHRRPSLGLFALGICLSLFGGFDVLFQESGEILNKLTNNLFGKSALD